MAKLPTANIRIYKPTLKALSAAKARYGKSFPKILDTVFMNLPKKEMDRMFIQKKGKKKGGICGF